MNPFRQNTHHPPICSFRAHTHTHTNRERERSSHIRLVQRIRLCFLLIIVNPQTFGEIPKFLTSP